MLQSAREILGYRIQAADGRIGVVSDFYLDRSGWQVRYVVADTGLWLPGRLVLLSPQSVGQPDGENERLPVKLTRQQVEAAPGIERDMPVSRRNELALAKHFGWATYWQTGPLGDEITGSLAAEAGLVGRQAVEGLAGTSLWSCREIIHYRIAASDGELGHAEDFLIDAESWHVRYLAIDTRNWLPGPHVLAATDWIGEIDWADSRIALPLPREIIRTAPEYSDPEAVTREYEENLYRHYGREGYWAK